MTEGYRKSGFAVPFFVIGMDNEENPIEII